MSAIEKKLMTVDEYLIWADSRPGRFELINGVLVAMSPEKIIHGETKLRVVNALAQGINRADLPYRALPDGMTVRITEHQVYEPDALVYCGERLPGDDMIVPNPVIVVEVLFPSTRHVDTGSKFSGYFSVASIRHYLIIDVDKRILIHHSKDENGKITSAMLTDGQLQLDPPDMSIKVEAMFAEAE